MQDAILKLKSMGQMPSDYDDIADEKLETYGALIKEIQTPINLNEVKSLIYLFPETSLFGLEWTLLHVLETVIKCDDFDANTYQQILEQCPSKEWRSTLLKRFGNYFNAC